MQRRTATSNGEAGSSRVETVRLVPAALPVAGVGLGVIVTAAVSFAASAPPPTVVGGMLALLAAATFVEAYPVPIDGIASGGISLAAVFIVGAAVLFGWEAGAMVGFLARAIVELELRRPAIRLGYNSAVYALAGAGAGLAGATAAGDDSVAELFVKVVLASAGFYVANVALVAPIVALSSSEPPLRLLLRSIRRTVLPFSIMASMSLMLEVLWARSPLFAAALVGPLVALALYQRSVHRELRAMRLALTDPLTGLGNHRHFHERLDQELAAARERAGPLALCLLDVDDFKRINDTYGHPVGDRVLAVVAARLRAGGEAFRLGGDEFALLLPGRREEEAASIARMVALRLAAVELEGLGPVSVSAGVAAYPERAAERGELVRAADGALYRAKRRGKRHVVEHVGSEPPADAIRPGRLELTAPPGGPG